MNMPRMEKRKGKKKGDREGRRKGAIREKINPGKKWDCSL